MLLCHRNVTQGYQECNVIASSIYRNIALGLQPLSKMIQTISMGHIMLLLYFFSVGFKMNVLFGARFEHLILDLTRC